MISPGKGCLKLNQLVYGSSMDKNLGLILEEAVRLTDSTVGFLHFIDEDACTISLQKWLKETNMMEEIPVPETHTLKSISGIQADCIKERQPIINKHCNSEKFCIGIPGELISISRGLTIPIFENERITAIISVGNKPGPYEDYDTEQLSLLGENLWNIIVRKRTVHDLELAHEEALESNKVKDRFFSIIAHDLSNPISNIRILADHFKTLISKPSPDRGTLRELSEILSRSAATAQELLNNLLEWSRAQRNALEFQPGNYPAELSAEMAIEACKPIATGKNITIKELWEKGITVYADSNMLQTILRNLLVNAIKFTDVGGEISLELSSDKEGTRYTIRDDGIGMTDEKVSSLFRIEKMKSIRGTNAEKGTGLGLVLCKEFVDCHRGIINAVSTPGKGSTFTNPSPFFKPGS